MDMEGTDMTLAATVKPPLAKLANPLKRNRKYGVLLLRILCAPLVEQQARLQ